MATFVVIPLLLVSLFASSVIAQDANSTELPHVPAPPFVSELTDKDILQFALNLEYLEAEFYAYSAWGQGVYETNATLTGNGSLPYGGKQAILSQQAYNFAEVLALHEFSHITVIRDLLGDSALPEPYIDIGAPGAWTTFFQAVFNSSTLMYDPYADDLSWLCAGYVLPYVGELAYVGSNPLFNTTWGKEFLAGVLAIEGSQDAMFRTWLWLRQNQIVPQSRQSVANTTDLISKLRNTLDGTYPTQIDDRGLLVARNNGSYHMTSQEILVVNPTSGLAYARTAEQTIQIIYGTGDASKPGGFFPNGCVGRICNYYLNGTFA
jgi:hypothetical protein